MYGFRAFIAKEMTGRLIAGSIQRRCHDDYQQIIFMVARGAPTDLQAMETSVLNYTADAAQDDSTGGSDRVKLWMWEPGGPREPIEDIGAFGFIILSDTMGAERGVGSDERHDYKSISSQRSSVSSTKSGSIKAGSIKAGGTVDVKLT